MRTSESIGALATALALAQTEIENAAKSSTNPHFKSRYADLAEVINTCRPVLAKHAICIVQSPSYDAADGIAHVDTRLIHKSGEWMEGRASAPVVKTDPQGVGSATTYLRRYALAAMVGIAQEDDDAEQSVGRSAPPRQPPQRAHPQPDNRKPQRLPPPSEEARELARKILATGMLTSMPKVHIVDRAEAFACEQLAVMRGRQITGSEWDPDERTRRAIDWISAAAVEG